MKFCRVLLAKRKCIMFSLIFVSILSSYLWPTFALAKEVEFKPIDGKVVYDDPNDLELSVKAKQKRYLGGRDEGELKIQQQLNQPYKKSSGNSVIEEENSAD